MINELNNLYGVSGLENDVRLYINEKIKGLCDETYIDSIGNLHAIKNNGNKNICLVTNMDEPGVIITKITDDGYLKFDTVGRINPSFLISKKISINGITGIISLKAIHLASKEERKKAVKAEQLFIDIGAKSKDDAEQIVDIGDYGVIQEEYSVLNNNFIKGRALGGRAGCIVAIDLLKQELKCNLHVIFSVQREINNRGISVGINDICADLAVVFDGIEAADYHITQNRPESGKGCILLNRTGAGNMSIDKISVLNNLANNSNISIQNHITTEKGPEYEIIKNTSIKECVCIGLPVKYIRSSSQVANLSDIDGMYKLSLILLNKVIKGC